MNTIEMVEVTAKSEVSKCASLMLLMFIVMCTLG